MVLSVTMHADESTSKFFSSAFFSLFFFPGSLSCPKTARYFGVCSRVSSPIPRIGTLFLDEEGFSIQVIFIPLACYTTATASAAESMTYALAS